jgi:glycosyltransferase involved in cell wall biosynthesis
VGKIRGKIVGNFTAMPLTENVALVVDALPGLGGSEKVLMAAMELFPKAPIYTLIYNSPAFSHTPIARRRVVTSYLERLPLAHKHYRKFLPLMPHAIAQFDLSRFDKVISFSYAVAHGIPTYAGQTHFSYTYTPMRYAWRNFGLDGLQKPFNPLLTTIFSPFRNWDLTAIENVAGLAAVSHWIKDWVGRIYKRDSTVIYPPVEVERFTPQLERENYYITVSRLVAHKRIDLMVEAFNRLKLPLLVVGDGPIRAQLEQRAAENIHFLGYLPDEQVNDLLNRAHGYICAGEEDFGIALIEAQAAGCPVIAYGRGGALETVAAGETGLLFDEPNAEGLVEAVKIFETQIRNFNALNISQKTQRFNKRRFLQEFAGFAGVATDL